MRSLRAKISEVSIEITQKCPCSCLHCSSDSGPDCNVELSEGVLSSLIESIISMDVERVSISGGEPFLHANLFNMVSRLHSGGVKCVVYSSGMTIDREGRIVPVSYSGYKKLAGRAVIVFNVAAIDETVCDEVMGTKGHLSLLKESIDRARRAGLRCEAHFVPNKVNRCDPDSLLSFWFSLI